MISYSADGYAGWLRENAKSDHAPGVFICDDDALFPGLIEALARRGWVRNNDLKSPFFNLKWTRLSDDIAGAPGAVINHTQGTDTLTRKRLFYEKLQERCLALCNRHCDAFLPRAFDISINASTAEVADFVSDFYLTKATCVLQHHVAGKPVSPAGLAAAKSVAQRYLGNKCIDGNEIFGGPEAAWAKQAGVEFDTLPSEKRELDAVRLSGLSSDSAAGDTSNGPLNDGTPVDEVAELLARYAEDASFQYDLQGEAANWWILKPGQMSRSIGIQVVADSLSGIMKFKGTDYVCMKYIERPLLIEGRKQDIRQLVFTVGLDKPEGGQCYFYPERPRRGRESSFGC